MDAEPFVPTPEKAAVGSTLSENLTAFKRNLFSKDPPQNKGAQLPIRYGGDGKAREHLPEGRGEGFREAQETVEAIDCEDAVRSGSDLPKQYEGGSLRAEPDSMFDYGTKDPQIGGRAPKRLHGSNDHGESDTPNAFARPEPESCFLHTPLKAKRPDVDSPSLLFTPPPAPATRLSSFASSPITPLADATHAPERRVPRKKSSKLKALSMQLKEAGGASQDRSDAATSGETSEASEHSANTDTFAAHPYALIASVQPAEELAGDPKYRGMAALGCQHQYTEADRASFLHRRKIIAQASSPAEPL